MGNQMPSIPTSSTDNKKAGQANTEPAIAILE